MGNPQRGEASFEALGEVWTLRFNTNALAEFEEVAGVSVASLGGGMGIRQLRAIVWCGLGFHHRRTRGNLDNVGNMIDQVGAMEMGDIITRAMSNAFPQKEGDGKSPPKAAQSEDGSTS